MVESISRNQGNVVLAASLKRIASPQGFAQFGRNEQVVIPGFSSNTATLLFEPIVNVVDQQNELLKQRMLSRLEDPPERVDARTVAARFRNREAIENPALRRTPQDVLDDLKARFGISSEGPRTPYASISARPTLVEQFGSQTSGYGVELGLSPLVDTRVAIGGGETLAVSDLAVGTSPLTPEKVLVRLDSSGRNTEGNLLSAEGSLVLNGTTLASGVVHELTAAEYDQLQYVAGTASAMDYLSVVGVDQTNQLRGELVTTAITTNSLGVETFIRDGLDRFEFIAMTEASVPIPRVSIDFEGTFANGDAIADINAGAFEVTINQFGNLSNVGTNLLQQSTGNTLDVSFGSSPPVDGVVVTVKALDPTVDISNIRVTLS